VLGPAVPNLDERRIVARRKAGQWHVVIYDGPTTPEYAGNRRREALVRRAGFKNLAKKKPFKKKTEVSKGFVHHLSQPLGPPLPGPLRTYAAALLGPPLPGPLLTYSPAMTYGIHACPGDSLLAPKPRCAQG
jgi:hypothetical protein